MKRMVGVLFIVASLFGGPARGWWGDGHGILTRAAVRALPGELPVFFRQGEATAASAAYDPDLFKNRAAPHLYDAEHGEHYFDVELFGGRPIPDKRYAFLDSCAAIGLAPTRIGLLPYALAEWTERLAIAFAEHRRWPEDLSAQHKCLVYAGMLAHYAQDACQPLHVTVDFDGRKQADGSVEGQGIHESMDALVERLGFAPEELAKKQELRNLAPLMPGILAQIDASRTRINRGYELAGELEKVELAKVRAFGEERARAAVNFTGSLYWTAWRLSEEVRLPSWLER